MRESNCYTSFGKGELKNENRNFNVLKLIHQSKLKPFEDNPYKVLMNDSMDELVESIRQNGILNPIIVRPHDQGGYEIISGHRRVAACRIAKVHKIPSFIKMLDDDSAAILLVDSNLHREKILPSEKAFAYKLKLDAMNRQGIRSDLTSSQIGTKLRTDEIIAKEAGESRNQIHRYIRLTNLIDALLDMVDNKKIPVSAAVELSYLGSMAQADIAEILKRDEIQISIKQAAQIREISSEGKISLKSIEMILFERVPERIKITLTNKRIRQYFPEKYSKSQIEKIIFSLIESWYNKQNNIKKN